MRRIIATCAASFCPKNAASGFHDMKQFRHHGRNPAKMSRPRTPIQLLAQSFHRHPRDAHPAGYISSTDGANSNSHALPLQHFAVALKRPRILRQILIRPKLRRIHKDRCRHHIARARAARTSERCPSCSAPMVGTNPSRLPARRKRPREAVFACRENGVMAGSFNGFEIANEVPASLTRLREWDLRTAAIRRHPLHRDMRSLQHPAHNSFVAADRHPILLRASAPISRSPPPPAHKANSKPATPPAPAATRQASK